MKGNDHFLKSSCVFWVTALYQMRLCRYFLLVFGLSSHSFNSVFTEQKFLILVKSGYQLFPLWIMLWCI